MRVLRLHLGAGEPSAVAPIYVLIGMSLGIYMGAANDFSLAPARP